MKRIFSFLLALTLCLSGCSAPVNNSDPTDGTTSPTTGNSSAPTTGNPTSPTVGPQTDQEMFTQRDSDPSYDSNSAVKITLKGSSASATSNAVKISGSTVKITEEATYVVTGTLDNGMLVVDAPKNAKVQIVLNGASITSKTYAPLLILQADKVFVTLADGTQNALSGGERFSPIDDIDIDGAVFSKTDLTFNGGGSLTVTAPAGHGIVCKDDLVFTGGNLTVNCASHAIDANDSVRISNAVITVKAGMDGIHAENNDDANLGFVYISGGIFDLTAEGDGISAGNFLQLNGGTFTITAGGGSANGKAHSSGGFGGFPGSKPGSRPGSNNTTTTDDGTSMKALKAVTDLKISGGTFTIDSADDALHTNGNLYLENGTFTIATGDDGIHADQELYITGGTVTITKSYEGVEALHIKISGGDITLTATDDGLNAAGGVDQSGTGGRDNGMFGGMPGRPGGMGGNSNGSIVISGGKLNITSSGDGIDANGTLEITGGHITVCGPNSGDTATLDFDKTGVITGGTFIGTGASGMAQTFSSSEQGVISLRVGSTNANTQITLTDSTGKVLFTHTPHLAFSVVILSSPELKKGETYTITVGTKTSECKAS